MPPEVQEEVTLGMRASDGTNLRLALLHEHLDPVRDRLQVPDQTVELGRVHRVAQLGQLQADQVHRRDLRDECLGRRDADLEAGPRVQDAVGVTRRLAAEDVRDRQHLRAAAAREAHRRERVGGLTGLRDTDHEVVGTDHRVAIAVLRGDVHLDRDARPLLDRVAAYEAGVVRGPARDDHDAAARGQLVVGDADVAQVDGVVVGEPVGDRLRDRVGLLVDLLQHESRVAGLLGGLFVPGYLLDLAGDPLAGRAAELDAAAAHGHDLVVVDQLHVARLAQERGDRRRDEVLSLAHADHERAVLAGADDRVGVVGRYGDERVVAAQLQIGEPRCLGEASCAEHLEVLLDQVRDGLCVGLGREVVALGSRAGRAAPRSSR